MACDNTALADVCDAIERYFRRYPAAADTAEGAQRWWLGLERYSVEDVRAALDALVASGRVERRGSPGREPTYLLRRTHTTNGH